MKTTNMAKFFISFLLFLSCASDTSSVNNNRITGSDPEHHIQDSQDILSFDSVLYTRWYYIVDTNTGYNRRLTMSEEAYSLIQNQL